MADFERLARTAKRLIGANGRSVSVRKVTVAAAPDPTKPWVPGAEAVSDTGGTGVFLDTQRSFLTGELIPEDQSQVLVDAEALGAVIPIGKDRLVDGTDVWEIVKVVSLKPGDVALLYELRIKK